MNALVRFVVDFVALLALGKMSCDAYGVQSIAPVTLVFVVYSLWVWADGIRVGRR